MNRQEKRLLQRQGEIDENGQPVAKSRADRAAQPRTSGRAPSAPRSTPLGYLRGVRSELKKVAWPTPSEVRKFSIVVLATLAVMGALIFGLDTAFSQAALFLFK